MQVAFNTMFQDYGLTRTDQVMFKEEMHLLNQVEDLGFDALLVPEHHFDKNYSAVPDNFMILSAIAARTSTLKLHLGAVILPWNNPLRVIEKISLLDHLSDGRVILSLGRGLSKMEYYGMGIDMEESRGRFDEGAKMVLDALRTGRIEGAGPHYPQHSVEVRPALPRSLGPSDVYFVGMSPESSLVAGDHGARLLAFTTMPLENHITVFDSYRERFRASTGNEAPPVHMTDFGFCHEDGDYAREQAYIYVANYFKSVNDHYTFDGEHFAKTAGYTSYAAGAQAIREAGIEAAARAYVDVQANIGTPDEIFENYRVRYETLGGVDAGTGWFYGGMQLADAERSVKLFAREVLPELQKLERKATVSA